MVELGLDGACLTPPLTSMLRTLLRERRGASIFNFYFIILKASCWPLKCYLGWGEPRQVQAHNKPSGRR